MKRPIEIGPLCPTLKEQLAGVKISAPLLARLEADNRAINRCFVCGYISAAQFDVAGKRLIKAVQRAIDKGAAAPGGNNAVSNGRRPLAPQPVGPAENEA